MATFLAGDIGATKSLLSFAEGQSKTPPLVRHYASAAYTSFEALLSDFLAQTGAHKSPISSACFAIAGPVINDTVQLTNLPWEIAGKDLRKKYRIGRLRLINDAQAAGYGLSELDAANVQVLQQDRSSSNDTQLLIGAGTGLGVAIVVSSLGRKIVLPSEGGHMGFAPQDHFERQLLNYLTGPLKQVTQEDLLSGKGLVRLFDYLKVQSGLHSSITANDIINTDDSRAAEISRLAASGKCKCAVEALERFTRIYGAFARNMALLCFPNSGVYITGGIAPKIATQLDNGTFIESFNNNPRMRRVLKEFPVRLVLDPNVSLYGAQWLARTEYLAGPIR